MGKYIIEVDESEIVECWNEQAAKELGYQEYALKKYPKIKVKPYNPSGDLVSREALKETLRSYPQTDDMRTTELIGFFEKLIDNAPAIDISGNEYFPYRSAYFNGVADGRAAAIPKGEWINHRNDYGHNIADCSLCGKTMQWHDEDGDGIPRYCWYCGASMKGCKG